MNFPESEKYLNSLGNEVETMKLGLENIRMLLGLLGDPQKRYFKVQVAGTNGKGSVCAFLDSICNTAGLGTGTFTSPHLISITERVKIHGHPISEEAFATTATRVRDVIEAAINAGELGSTPTFFEQITAIALLAFADAGVEVAILETGLGGRLDATTAADAEVGVITRIDYDHQQYLGETIEQIASEKAAIIRPDSRAVLVRQEENVENVLVGRCREVGVDPVWTTQDIRAARIEEVPVLFGSITTARAHYGKLELWGMRGRHQFENAAAAAAAAEQLQDAGFQLSKDDILLGLEAARHPGRLEYDGRFLFDGAHNIGGVKSLVSYLEEFERRPFTLVYGAMSDKDVAEMTRLLFPRAERIILTRPANKRSLTSDEIREQCGPTFDVIETKSVSEALEIAEAAEPELIVVTGSLYLIGEAKELIRPWRRRGSETW